MKKNGAKIPNPRFGEGRNGLFGKKMSIAFDVCENDYVPLFPACHILPSVRVKVGIRVGNRIVNSDD